MINIVGGIITAIMAFGIYQKKLSPRLMELRLAALPIYVQPIIPAILALLLWTSLFGMNNILGVPHAVLSWASFFIHEGGHFYLVWAGRFLNILGGTLFELGVPAVLAACFCGLRHYRWSALFIAWLSVGLFNVAQYAGDAQAMELHLVGSGKEGHDWNNMLSMFNLLDATPIISDIFWSVGVVAGLISILLYGWTMYADRNAAGALDQKRS